MNFNIEVTDTFSGEANYCWVRRYEVKAKSILGAINIVSRKEGLRFNKAWEVDGTARYNARHASICAFVQEVL